MTVRVISKRAGGIKAKAGEVVVNIARPSVLGNPFFMRSEDQRAQVIVDYRAWLTKHYRTDNSVWAEVKKLAARVKAGEHLALECWCAPCACHGDVIIDAIEFINKE